jgi:sialate O-acetylesterase
MSAQSLEFIPGLHHRIGRLNAMADRILEEHGNMSSKELFKIIRREWRKDVRQRDVDLYDLSLLKNSPNFPTLLSNAMIEPLIPYAIRGVIWYQGESNTGRPLQYGKLFPRLIQDWRQRWNQGNFPFLFVQLANFLPDNDTPIGDNWALLREAQLLALDEPNTGMAVAIDIGDPKNIHPKNKQEVGRRLALNALKIAYGQDIVASGPIYHNMQIENGKIRLRFLNVADGLVFKNGKDLKGFTISGKDRVFRRAEAKIDGDTVIVWHPQIKRPEAARYAWAPSPICNLYNSAGLPASPFRTDNWPR